jgi:hypothetical protein
VRGAIDPGEGDDDLDGALDGLSLLAGEHCFF